MKFRTISCTVGVCVTERDVVLSAPVTVGVARSLSVLLTSVGISRSTEMIVFFRVSVLPSFLLKVFVIVTVVDVLVVTTVLLGDALRNSTGVLRNEDDDDEM